MKPKVSWFYSCSSQDILQSYLIYLIKIYHTSSEFHQLALTLPYLKSWQKSGCVVYSSLNQNCSIFEKIMSSTGMLPDSVLVFG